MPRSITERILRFNRGRDEALLQRKFERMRAGPFPFFRGSCHLFFEDWDGGDKLDRTPRAWISGDLHLENFGAYKGENRLVHFDLNDFDEAALAPCSWELARFATSVRLAAGEIGLAARRGDALVEHFLSSYAAVLAHGKARWVEHATAEGVVRELLDRASGRSRKELLDRRTEMKNGRRRLRLDGERALRATAAQRKEVQRFLRDRGGESDRPEFFRVLDVARRVAGTGSLGVERYVVLVEGKGGPDQNHLIDLKFAIPSAPASRLRKRQPGWTSEAARVVAIQTRCQAVSPALLGVAELASGAFVMRELQPVEDRLELDGLAHGGRFESALSTMALVVASAHLRSGGREGAAIADDWIAFGEKTAWIDRIARYSARYHQTVIKDWRRFRKGT
jgi:uncharacterized protein (DUF2252 family)